MNFKTFNRVTISGLVLSAIIVMCFNIYIDPYSIFNVSGINDGNSLNTRYQKIVHIMNHKNKYNSFIVGSSKMGVYDPEFVNARYPGANYYNLNVFAGDQYDALVMLKHLVDSGVNVENVIFGIDLFPFFEMPDRDAIARKHHPDITNESWFSFYKSYLFAQTLKDGLLKLMQINQEVPDIKFDIEETGRFYLTRWDEDRAKNIKDYNSKHFKEKVLKRSDAVVNEKALVDLKDLLDWMKEEGIFAKLFIQPHHRFDLDRVLSSSSIEKAVASILQITGQIPNYYHSWSSDDDLFYEPKHYTPELAQTVLIDLIGSGDEIHPMNERFNYPTRSVGFNTNLKVPKS